MVEFANVTFDDRAMATVDLLRSMNFELAAVPVGDDRYCIAVWSAHRKIVEQSQQKLLRQFDGMLADEQCCQSLVFYHQCLTTGRVMRDEAGGWLLFFSQLVGYLGETIH